MQRAPAPRVRARACCTKCWTSTAQHRHAGNIEDCRYTGPEHCAHKAALGYLDAASAVSLALHIRTILPGDWARACLVRIKGGLNAVVVLHHSRIKPIVHAGATTCKKHKRKHLRKHKHAASSNKSYISIIHPPSPIAHTDLSSSGPLRARHGQVNLQPITVVWHVGWQEGRKRRPRQSLNRGRCIVARWTAGGLGTAAKCITYS